jgi:hypothetical protein
LFSEDLLDRGLRPVQDRVGAGPVALVGLPCGAQQHEYPDQSVLHAVV